MLTYGATCHFIVPELDACFAALNLGQFVTDEAKTAGAAS